MYYYHNGIEVDFVIPDEKLVVQTAYSIKDFDTRKREINVLVQISKRMEIAQFLIITKDEEETITEGGIKIEVIPALKWLLSVEGR